MNNNTELILIRITGLDRPGLTASITEILSKYDVTILDIGQADIHSTLSLGILFKSQEKDSGNIMKELLFKASALGINIRFYPVTVEEYEEWVNMQGKNRYILTLLGRKLTAKQIAAVTGILAEQGLNIDAIIVEISPNAAPPVCRVIDYQKFLYQQKKRQKEQKAKSVKVVVKEIRFGPQTDDHDYNFKLKHAKGFLEEGSKVKAYVFFKGRSILFNIQ